MRHVGDRWVVSATDIAAAAHCEFALLRRLDTALGRLPGPQVAEDPLLARLSQLGTVHEERETERLRAERGLDGVLAIGRPAHTHAALTAAAQQTARALHEGVPVVTQACLYDGDVVGFADFLVRSPEWTPQQPVYEVVDTKLARHARAEALLQLGTYAGLLRSAGICPDREVRLVLGDRTRPGYATQEVELVAAQARSRLLAAVAERLAATAPVGWEEVMACGRCETCQAEVESTRDLLLVARLRLSQRVLLREQGIHTIDELAHSTGPVAGIPESTLATLRAQAALQLEGEAAGEVVAEVFDPGQLARLPQPDPGDVFFDFEGDPLWTDGTEDQGLEYLFGAMTTDGQFRPFWAHDRGEERQALIDFVDWVHERRAEHPGMHVYHYADYERAALLRLAARHGVYEEEVDALLRANVLVDLYAVVRAGVRVSTRSYSIKKLEPLYMGADLRESTVADGAASIVEYHRYATAVALGDSTQAAEILEQIRDYNEYDCRSTLRLRDWLWDRRDPAATTDDAEVEVREVSEKTAERLALAARLMDGLPDALDRTPEQRAIALVAAAVNYFSREAKPFWHKHFDRLNSPIGDWEDSPEVLRLTQAEVVTDWAKPTARARTLARALRVITTPVGGQLPPAKMWPVYAMPAPAVTESPGLGGYGWLNKAAEVTVVEEFEDGRIVVDLVEALPQKADGHAQLPLAAVIADQDYSDPLAASLTALAQRVEAEGLPQDHPGVQLLLRAAPRFTTGGLAPVTGTTADAITDAVRRLDRSVLAVQGPPGTGKTFVAATVIERLVAEGWRIGVVAQSHAVVENVLETAIGRGIPADRVVKKIDPGAADGGADRSWTVVTDKKQIPGLLPSGGALVGGTAWDFVGDTFGEKFFDLLIVDEAGQFSLAHTLAASRAAQRLLLLGDPRQLPQVTQARHPEPIDSSALGWVMGDEPVLPADRGYFLAESWRMHPAVCAAVSELSYAGQLHSRADVTAARSLEGTTAGIRLELVEHEGRDLASPEEADRIVTVIQDLLGRDWTADAGAASRPLAQTDVLVVAPYNAQVDLVRSRLRAAGLGAVQVGTVDKFQGREAAVAIVSMTASSLAELPRGADFLLSRNRLNVAISRAKWQAIIVRSAGLTDVVPRTPEEVVQLGAFLRLCAQAVA
ncbi:TM0106 family RecB-like putative nuclease [Metallococcus carri]|uniref:TM0106 family RecB-like putative nuclease n=1 Tax=Metallococcus carri TaxID=1656884 RepID=UPI002E2AFFFE|nr:TM0106 family RecB-like putative nuclease [Metallococcus carri]